MESSEVAHHVGSFSVVGVKPEVRISGNTTLAPVGTMISCWLPGESIRES